MCSNQNSSTCRLWAAASLVAVASAPVEWQHSCCRRSPCSPRVRTLGAVRALHARSSNSPFCNCCLLTLCITQPSNFHSRRMNGVAAWGLTFVSASLHRLGFTQFLAYPLSKSRVVHPCCKPAEFSVFTAHVLQLRSPSSGAHGRASAIWWPALRWPVPAATIPAARAAPGTGPIRSSCCAKRTPGH